MVKGERKTEDVSGKNYLLRSNDVDDVDDCNFEGGPKEWKRPADKGLRTKGLR